jgi:hypothetical protein
MIIFLMHKKTVNVCLNNDSVLAKNLFINGISEFFDEIFESIKFLKLCVLTNSAFVD